MKNDELEVENYSADELKRKKKNILTKVAIVGGAVVAAVLVYFGLIQPGVVEIVPTNDFIVGGNGAWFNSVVEFEKA